MTERISGGRVTPRTIYINGRQTSVRLEPIMWEALKDIALLQRTKRLALIQQIAADRAEDEPLASAIRVYIVAFYRSRNALSVITE